MNVKKMLAAAALAVTGIVTLAGCASDADVASENISKAAEQFEIERRIVAINGITDNYLLVVEGRCSVETTESQLGNSLEVTCKTGPNEYLRHSVGLSDNVTFVAEQTRAVNVDPYHYRLIFKPSTIVPDVDVVTP